MYLDELKIANLRTLVDVAISFRFSGDGVRSKQEGAVEFPNVNLLLGNNGSGKSTILRAIALGLLAPVIESSGYLPYSMVRREGEKTAKSAQVSASVQLHDQDLEGSRIVSPESRYALEVEIIKRRTTEILRSKVDVDTDSPWEAIFDDRSPAFLLVGYGATRRVEDSKNYDSGLRGKSRHLRYQRVASLFEEHVSLTPLAAWLPALKRVNRGRYTQVVNLIDRLLPAPFNFDGTFKDGEFFFHQNDNPVPFPALSDGYRAYLGWISDLLYHVCMGCPKGKKLVDNCGIVLVDEIDLHLHPAWQRVVVPMIAQALPNLQFVLTSHSPLVTGSLRRENIMVLSDQGMASVEVKQLDERVHGLTSEQILLSSYFNLGSTRASTITDQIASLVEQASANETSPALQAIKQLASAGRTESEATAAVRKKRPAKKRRARIPQAKAATNKRASRSKASSNTRKA